MPNALLQTLPSFAVDCQVDLSAIRLTSGVSVVRSKRFPLGFPTSFIVLLPSSSRSSYSKPGRVSYQFTDLGKSKPHPGKNDIQLLAGTLQGRQCYTSVHSINGETDKEIQRRRKIGLANKGKVPWNKGRLHSAETREKIRQRTREALNDPKVRKRMSESPRSLSSQTKARISFSLRNLWDQRLKGKRGREKFVQSWSDTIARAAKIGGTDQDNLDWDSYEKIETELSLQELQRASEKAKVRDTFHIQAERKAQAKPEKTARLAQKIREREENANTCGKLPRKANKKLKEQKGDSAVAPELKLKERLTKIQKKKMMTSGFSFQHQRGWDKFDLDFKGQHLHKAVSFEDQLRLAKNTRLERAATGNTF